MKNGIKAFYLLSLVVLMVSLCSGPILASAEAVKIEGYAGILMEPFSGEILYAKNANVKLPPASVTKLMVMLLAMEAVDRGQIKLTDMISASPEACKMGGSQIWLEPGEQMTVAELLKAVCIVSANDASYALGEHIAGSEEAFIALMNKRSGELGLKDTHYVNTTGLDPGNGSGGNVTSAMDQAILAQEMIKHPKIFQWTGVWIDALRGGKSYLRNTNNLVRFYRGCDGLKTGFTAQAGFCLVATAKRDGVRLVSVVMKSPTSQTRSQDVGKLLNYGFSKYKSVQVYQGGEKIGQVKTFRGKDEFVTAVVPREMSAVIKREQKGEIAKDVKLYPQVKAPVRKGDKVGEIIVTIDGQRRGQVDLVAERDIPRASFTEIIKRVFRNMMDRVVGKSKK